MGLLISAAIALAAMYGFWRALMCIPVVRRNQPEPLEWPRWVCRVMLWWKARRSPAPVIICRTAYRPFPGESEAMFRERARASGR